MRSSPRLRSLCFFLWAALCCAAFAEEEVILSDQNETFVFRYPEEEFSRKGEGEQLFLRIGPNDTEQIISKRAVSKTRGIEFPHDIFSTGNQVAIIELNEPGGVNYKRYAFSKGQWSLEATCPLGGLFLGAVGLQFKSLVDFEILRDDDPPIQFHVTDIPLISNGYGTAKLVLADGAPFHPRGIHIGDAVWDLPLAQIKANHEARLKAEARGEQSPSQPANSKPD